MTEGNRPRLIGINHVAIEVGDINEALDWYGRIFDFMLRGKGERAAFIDMGDQFINLTLTSDYAVNGVEKRHLGFVVDDRSRVITALGRAVRDADREVREAASWSLIRMLHDDAAHPVPAAQGAEHLTLP